MKRPAGVSRQVNGHRRISVGGFSQVPGATYSGEPVEAVVTSGLVEILRAGVLVATYAQRLRVDQAGRLPRPRVTRRARDAATGLTVTHLAGSSGTVSFAGPAYPAGRRWAAQASR